ncbi:MAG: hypothetical protein RTV72_08780 [Candidatus Thorarchaeota archaeon]
MGLTDREWVKLLGGILLVLIVVGVSLIVFVILSIVLILFQVDIFPEFTFWNVLVVSIVGALVMLALSWNRMNTISNGSASSDFPR